MKQMNVPVRGKRKGKIKKMATVMAFILVVTLLLGGALAWNDGSQHKTNEFDSGGKKHDIRLIDEFDKPDDWKQGQEIDKKIRVANVGKSSLGFQPVYTRIQFKEYMEIGEVLYEYSAVRYMIYTEDGPAGSGQYEGHFIVYPTLAAARDDWGLDRVYAQYTDMATGDSGWLVPTDAGDPDGQYGKKVLINVTTGVATSIIPGVVRASDDAIRDAGGTHDAGTNGECLYTVHSFDVGSAYYNNNTAKFAEYISWNLNGASMEYYSDWLANPSLAHTGHFWLVDDTNDEGWVYWMDAIQPDGGATANFMEAVTLIKQPEGAFYYAIHVEMEGYSLEQLQDSGWDAFVLGLLGSGAGYNDNITGSGTELDPYIIRTDKQMAWLAEVVNAAAADTFANDGSMFADKHWKLGNDIDLSAYGEGSSFNDGKGWVPIGRDTLCSFRGTFNGDGHQITALYINDDDISTPAGLFGCVCEGAINNLYVVGAKVFGYEQVGIIVGNITGDVIGCFASGKVDGRVGDVGGVAGVVDGSVTDCCSEAEVICDFYSISNFGGVAGRLLTGGSVTNCNVTGNVSGGFSNIGGVVGTTAVNTNVTDCHFSGTVYGRFSVGGLVGNASGSITNCSVMGGISGGDNTAGGVAGFLEGNITNCYAKCSVSAVKGGAGGVVCEVIGGSITNCYAVGEVFAGNGAGGVAAEVIEGSVINCYAEVNVTASHSGGAGGVVGIVHDGLVYGCYSTGWVAGGSFSGSDGSVVVLGGPGYVGGVAGYITDSRVENCVALNPSVWSFECDDGYAGRVVGRFDSGMLVGNMAFSGMTNNDGGYPDSNPFGLGLAFSGKNTSTGRDGADVSTAEIMADGTLGGRFTAPVWIAEDGKLPILAGLPGQDGTMPAHIK